MNEASVPETVDDVEATVEQCIDSVSDHSYAVSFQSVDVDEVPGLLQEICSRPSLSVGKCNF